MKRRRLADRTSLIEVAFVNPRCRRDVLATFTLREIVVQAVRRGFRPETIRLWTSLLDPATAPALKLARLYTQRWEQELYFRQLKLQLRRSEVLQSYIPETGAQEVAMLVLATALLAQERARAAAGQLPALELSFVKCADLLRPLWLILALAGQVLTPDQRQAVSAVVYQESRPAAKPNAATAPANAPCASPSKAGRLCSKRQAARSVLVAAEEKSSLTYQVPFERIKPSRQTAAGFAEERPAEV